MWWQAVEWIARQPEAYGRIIAQVNASAECILNATWRWAVWLWTAWWQAVEWIARQPEASDKIWEAFDLVCEYALSWDEYQWEWIGTLWWQAVEWIARQPEVYTWIMEFMEMVMTDILSTTGEKSVSLGTLWAAGAEALARSSLSYTYSYVDGRYQYIYTVNSGFIDKVFDVYDFLKENVMLSNQTDKVDVNIVFNIAHTITFDSNGWTEIDSITQPYGSSVIAPANPTRIGYEFVGWDKEIPENMPDEDITITAIWMAKWWSAGWWSNISSDEIKDKNVDDDGKNEKEAEVKDSQSDIVQDVDQWNVSFQRRRWNIWKTLKTKNIDRADIDIWVGEKTVVWGPYTVWKDIAMYDKSGEVMALMNPETAELEFQSWYQNSLDVKVFVQNSAVGDGQIEQQCIACFDLGEFARLYPGGASILEYFGAKDCLLKLIQHKNMELKNRALVCLQKIMMKSLKK